jgi:hypothetical protein
MLTQPHGQRTDFGAAGHDIFTSATSSLLKGAEGSLLKGFGIGKVDGSSAGNALWVRMTSVIAGGGKAASSAVASAGNWGSSILHALHIPGFAGGGDYDGNSPFWAGEEGPEIINPTGSGSVIPNSKINAGGGGDNHFHIDATGSADPAQVEAAVWRGIKAAAPHMVNAAVHAVSSQRGRKPAGASY